MNKHFNINVSGEVIGVGFRYRSKIKADELHITGFVRNEPSGNLYIEAEGEETKLNEFVDWCRIGPKYAKVEGVRVETSVHRNFKQFEIYEN